MTKGAEKVPCHQGTKKVHQCNAAMNMLDVAIDVAECNQETSAGDLLWWQRHLKNLNNQPFDLLASMTKLAIAGSNATNFVNSAE